MMRPWLRGVGCGEAEGRGSGPVQLCTGSPRPRAGSASGIPLLSLYEEGAARFPLPAGPWAPCGHRKRPPGGAWARTSLPARLRGVLCPQLADQTRPSPGLKPQPSSTPHFPGESSRSPLPDSPLGLGCLPLTSSTRISQRKTVRHESPWRGLGLVPGRLRARLGLLQPWPPSPAPPPGAPLPGAAPWDSCRFQAQAHVSPHWETMMLCPAPATRPPCLPLLTPLAPTFQNKKNSPAPGTGIRQQ